MSSPGSSRQILFLIFPGFQILDLTGPLQMFAAANDALGREAYRLRVAAASGGPCGASCRLQLSVGLTLEDLDDEFLSKIDTLAVVGGDPGLRPALAEGAIAGVVRRAAGRARRIVSVCSGAFFLASAGLLDGRRATTHWQAAEALQAQWPAISVDPDAIFIRDEPVWTSAGVTAGIDLALALIEDDHSRALALEIARRHVVTRIRSGGQSQFSADLIGQAARSGPLDGLVRQITDAPHLNWSVEALAEAAGRSVRTLSRLFRRELQISPADFVERLRVDLARSALLETATSVSLIAEKVGFGSLRRMDRAFRRHLGASPTEFRKRFQSGSPQ